LDRNLLNDVIGNPTCENLAAWLWNRLGIPGLSSLELWDTPTSGCKMTAAHDVSPSPRTYWSPSWTDEYGEPNVAGYPVRLDQFLTHLEVASLEPPPGASEVRPNVHPNGSHPTLSPPPLTVFCVDVRRDPQADKAGIHVKVWPRCGEREEVMSASTQQKRRLAA
jgi:hypothetical protein